MKYKGIIFDLDGVILTTDTLHYKSWKELADTLNIHFNREINEQFRGVSRENCLNILLSLNSLTMTQGEKELYLKKKNDNYLKLLETIDYSFLLPNVINTLEELKSKNYLLAIGSSSKNARVILDKLKLKDYFTSIIDGNDISESKPSPEVFLKARDELNLLSTECLVIEDAESGIEAANNAKIDVLYYGKRDAKGTIGYVEDIYNLFNFL